MGETVEVTMRRHSDFSMRSRTIVNNCLTFVQPLHLHRRTHGGGASNWKTTLLLGDTGRRGGGGGGGGGGGSIAVTLTSAPCTPQNPVVVVASPSSNHQQPTGVPVAAVPRILSRNVNGTCKLSGKLSVSRSRQESKTL